MKLHFLQSKEKFSEAQINLILKIGFIFGLLWGFAYLLGQGNLFVKYTPEFGGESELMLPNLLGILLWLLPFYVVLKFESWQKKKHADKVPYLQLLSLALFIAFLSIPLGGFLGSTVGWRAPSFWMVAFYFLVSVYLLSAYVARKELIKHFSLVHLLLIFISFTFFSLWILIVVLWSIGIGIKEIYSFLVSRLKDKKWKWVFKALLILASIGFAYLLIGLLAKADPLFNNVYVVLTKYLLLKKWLAFGFYVILGIISVASLVVFIYRLAPKYLWFLFLKPKTIVSDLRKQISKLPVNIPVIFYLVPLLTLGLFILVQLYVVFFIGKVHLLEYYHFETYSQYAKRGVVELIFGSSLFVISLYFLYLSFFAKNKKIKKKNIYILVLITIGLVSLGLLSLYKVVLYISTSGFTLKRLLALYFVFAFIFGVFWIFSGTIKDVKTETPIYYSFLVNGVSLRIIIWALFTFAGFVFIPWLSITSILLANSSHFIQLFNPRYELVSPSTAYYVGAKKGVVLKQNLITLHAVEQYGQFYVESIQGKCNKPVVNTNLFIFYQNKYFAKLMGKSCIDKKLLKQKIETIRSKIYDSLQDPLQQLGVTREDMTKEFSCVYEYAARGMPFDFGPFPKDVDEFLSIDVGKNAEETLTCTIFDKSKNYLNDKIPPVPYGANDFSPKAYIVFRDAQNGKILVDVYNSRGEKTSTLQF